jgi:hypothetical protein
VNVFKSPAERRIEAATWGTLLVWVGISLGITLPKGVPGLVAGLILLASAILQKALGWEAGIILWAAGLALSLSGLNDLTNGKHHIPALAIILILIGGSILLRALAGGGSDRRRHLSDVSRPRGPYRDV